MTKKPSAVKTQRRRRPKAPSSIPSTETNDRYYSKAIGRAFEILDCFRDPLVSLNLKEISQITGLSMSSLFRVLVTLEGHSYLRKNEDGTYVLSPKSLFGRVRERAERVREIAHGLLEGLARKFNETGSMAYLFDDYIQVLDSVDSYHEIRHSNRVGRILPPHCSSMGKAITAFQQPDRIDSILEGYGLYPRTPNTITDRAALHAEFQQIRRLGFAFDRNEAVEGGICVGAPIVAPNGSVSAAISISVPVPRMTEAREKEITDAVLETAAQIGRAIAQAGL